MVKCGTDKCTKEGKFRCPTCIKYGISGSYFCSQECFKGFWKSHRTIHVLFENAMKKTDTSTDELIWPGFDYTGKLRPYKQSERRVVPISIDRPDYADHPEGYPTSEVEAKAASMLVVLNDQEIEAMRVVSKLAREILDEGMAAVDVNVTTDEIDRIIHEASVERECYPSPLNYHNFPKSCCTSLNEVVCHGIPDKRPLQDKDILNIDVTAYHRGFHGDLNETVFVGTIEESSKKLVQATYECLQNAIKIVSPGAKYREIGDVISQHANLHGFSVVRNYCGHGIHRLFHCPPSVPHYSKNKAIGVMKPGHCFTIEPMINKGSWKGKLWQDNWTFVTVDGCPSAQFEETLLVTDTGVDVLTARTKSNGMPFFMEQLKIEGT